MVTSLETTASAKSGPVLGSRCKVAGATIGGGANVTFVCTKKNGKLVWENKREGKPTSTTTTSTTTTSTTPTTTTTTANSTLDPVFHTPCTNNPDPVFTANLSDPNYINFIQPMGLGQVGPRFRTFLWINTATAPAEIPIYAPVDSSLVDGVYVSKNGLVDYDLHFVVSCQVWYLINHISDPIAAIRQDLPATPQVGSTAVNGPTVTKILHFKAGDLLGYTTGTTNAHNFDFGVFNSSQDNGFANQARYKIADSQDKYLTAVCPYDYFTPDQKAVWYSKFGETGPVANATCGQINQDVLGTISGMWFVGPTSAGAEPVNLMVGVYTDGSVQISGQDISPIPIIYPSDPTYLDPATVTTDHCYASSGEYYFLRVVSATEIQLASGAGSCPAVFPSVNATNYYR
jgi:hypothetical protein